MAIKRGDIYFADLSPAMGSEQSGIRPVLVIQNDIGNLHSPTIIITAITGRKKKRMPTHVVLHQQGTGLWETSLIMLEQIRTIDRKRLMEYIGHADEKTMEMVDKALAVSVGIVI